MHNSSAFLICTKAGADKASASRTYMKAVEEGHMTWASHSSASEVVNNSSVCMMEEASAFPTCTRVEVHKTSASPTYTMEVVHKTSAFPTYTMEVVHTT